jgi:hypothetical protein
MIVAIPKRLAEELGSRGFDVESLIIDLLTKLLNLDPKVAAESHLELAERYFEEGRALVDKDPVQASERLYKGAEEVVKALAAHFGLRDILEDVEKSGRWSVTRLEKAVLRISKRLGKWFKYAWDAA